MTSGLSVLKDDVGQREMRLGSGGEGTLKTNTRLIDIGRSTLTIAIDKSKGQDPLLFSAHFAITSSHS